MIGSATSSARDFCDRGDVPSWERRAAVLLREAGAEVRLIGAATPLNLRSELRALCDAYGRGEERAPRFCYAPRPVPPGLGDALLGLADAVEQRGPLGELYAARARELYVETRLCALVGREELWPLARRRYGRRDGFDRQADELCARWLRDASLEEEAAAVVPSDDEADPRSLLCRMRAAVGARRLAFRVARSSHLSALAATGDGIIWVARKRALSERAVQRTVVHEIEGHALPRQRAARARLAIFACGTARGSDDQEGRALVCEARAGLLDRARRTELGLRHVAGRAVEERASFPETVARLADFGVPFPDCLCIAARAQRGGGLGREVIYLPAFLRVADAWRRDPCLDAVLGAGRVAVEAAGALRRWVS
ncbi:MAG: DUF1704 domain-containing protein [Deltaproteobacteria bacterium]|nr:DUF1704 domain-containing protein [Deltaproteobacteria bacterium]